MLKRSLIACLILSPYLLAASNVKANSGDFNLSNSVDNGLLPILIPNLDSTKENKNQDLRYNFKFDGYNNYHATRPKNYMPNGVNFLRLHQTNNGLTIGPSKQSQVGTYKDNKWSLHVSNTSTSLTFLVKTGTKPNNSNASITTLYNIVNVGAARKALNNPGTQVTYNGVSINQ
ncbi:MAG: hypothetical protein E7K04_02795, partial [Helicobacter sp.]|nr:hypothetical protein [Helicobacter sp.]